MICVTPEERTTGSFELRDLTTDGIEHVVRDMDEARDGPSISDLSPDLIETLEELRRGLVCFLGISTFDEEVARAGLPIPSTVS